MQLRIFDSAERDLEDGDHFYERQSQGLGIYFLDSLYSDIDSRLFFAGIHRKVFGHYRLLARRFPFAVYYEIVETEILVIAVLDCRRNPDWIRVRLRG